MTIDDDERGPVLGVEEILVAAGEHLEVVRVRDPCDIPAVPGEARGNVFAERPLGGAVQGDAIVVVNPAEIRKLQMAGERSRLARHTFHQVSVTTNGVHVEIENIETRAIVIFSEPFAGNGHAHAVSRALSQRPGGGFHAGRKMRFRMPWRPAVNLAEALDLFHGDGQIVRDIALCVDCAHPGKVKRGVEQHGGMPSRKHKTVAIGPCRIRRIVAQVMLPERIDHGR